MRKKIVAGLGLCTVLSVVGIAYGSMSNDSYASSMNNEAEMAGMSVMLQSYYDSHSEDIDISDPEAIVPIAVSGVAELMDNIVADTPEALEPVADTQTMDVVDGTVATDIVDAGQSVDASVQAEAGGVEPSVEQVTEPVATPEPVSEYANVGISIASQYVNIRNKPNTESKILGKLYRGSAATIVETKGDWVKIKSGSVNGYIKSEYLAIGFGAEELVDKYGTKLATVNVTTLKVREERSTDCTVLTLIPKGEEFEVTKEYDEWVRIIVDDTTKGYVSKECVDLCVEFEEAISIEEERAIERAKKEAEEAARRAEEAYRQAQERARAQAVAAAKKAQSSSSKSSSSSKLSGGTKVTSSGGTASSAASYAQQFVGNPYVYGGTSLTNGADCSGFVQSVYSKYGVSLPRTSSSQSNSGQSVSLSNVKAGDLVFYANNGRVNHVAMYIGGGKVVHASTRRDGIKISNMNYRTPYKARRVAN